MKALSRQQLARKRQGYDPDPALPICGNCEYFRSKLVENEWGGFDEKRRRCAIGGFAVKRKGSCHLHAPQKEAAGKASC